MLANNIQVTEKYLKYKKQLEAIDLAFDKMICFNGKNTNPNTSSMERSLKSIFSNDYKIIYNENNTMEFFGMQIYPKKEVMTDIAYRIAENKGYDTNQLLNILKTSDWIIEIDSKLFTDMNLKPTPQELTACILHEIGHSLDKNSIANRLYRTYVVKKAEMTQRFKNLVRYNGSIFRNLLILPVAVAFTCKTYRSDVFGSELVADKIPVAYGYGYNLQSFITKIIKIYGNNNINKSNGELDDDVNVIYTWIINNLNSLSVRQKNLTLAIAGETIKMPLLYIKDILKSIIPDSLNFDDVSNPEALYKMKGHDRILETSNQFLQDMAVKYCMNTEGLTSLFDNRRVREVKQADIDYISLEIDKIKDHDDRMFVMDLIYDQMDLIEASEDLIAQGKSNLVRMRPDKLKYFKKELNDLRMRVLNIKFDDADRYIANIKYPAGYEG